MTNTKITRVQYTIGNDEMHVTVSSELVDDDGVSYSGPVESFAFKQSELPGAWTDEDIQKAIDTQKAAEEAAKLAAE
jgi:hypothetical protein